MTHIGGNIPSDYTTEQVPGTTGTASKQSVYLLTANNFSDVPNLTLARLNLGLGSAAVLPSEALLSKTGGILTGALILASDPSSALEAATKQYVDNHSGGGDGGSYTLPIATSSVLGGVKQGTNVSISGNGTLSVTALIPTNNLSDISNVTVARTNLGLGNIAIHAVSDFDAAGTASTIAETLVPKSGGSMTGALILSSDPTTELQAATKAYVDANSSGSGYTLPIASSSELGGVKQGANIAIAEDGTISTTLYVLPQASVSTLGGVIAGTGLSAAAGTLSVNYGTTAGTAAQGNDSRIIGALQSSAIPSASGQLLGGSGSAGASSPITVGTGLTLSSGTLSVNPIVNVFHDLGTGAASSTQTINYTVGTYQRLQIGGALTIAVSNWPTSGNVGELFIELVNGGASVITWPTINWVLADGSFTTNFASNGVTLQASGIDFVLLWTHDGGITVYGKIMR